MSTRITRLAFATALLAGGVPQPVEAQSPRFEVVIAGSARSQPVTGRLIVVIAKNREPEPRYQISPSGAAMFAVDLDQTAAGTATVVDGSAIGYPGALGDIPVGKYWVQAVVNVYQRVTRSDGHSIWVPFNDGRQAPFQVAEGNLLSKPVEVDLSPGATVRLTIDQVVPQGSRSRGHRMGASLQDPEPEALGVLGPAGLHPRHGAPSARVRRPRPRDATPPSTRSATTCRSASRPIPRGFAGRGAINPVTGVETGYDFYLAWSSDSFPRMVAISFEQQTPYFPDGVLGQLGQQRPLRRCGRRGGDSPARERASG